MKHESGAPAFENIDDLLAERIVSHSKRHSGRPDERPSTPPVHQRPPAPQPPEEEKGNSGTMIVAAALALLALLFLLYRLSSRKPVRQPPAL
ncbi:MAG: hypothetical protein JW913_19025 [Chitinispirillaceae bacterium]|nr:hypothetical protein [Chitinispirillaceae bacterium]